MFYLFQNISFHIKLFYIVKITPYSSLVCLLRNHWRMIQINVCMNKKTASADHNSIHIRHQAKFYYMRTHCASHYFDRQLSTILLIQKLSFYTTFTFFNIIQKRRVGSFFSKHWCHPKVLVLQFCQVWFTVNVWSYT